MPKRWELVTLCKHVVLLTQCGATGGRGSVSVCIDCIYIQSVLMTSCVRNESEETSCAGCADSFEPQQEHAKSVETISVWRRFCRLLSRKNGEQLSPACLNELIKAQALKFSHLHHLDQFIQCQASKLNNLHVFSGQFVKNNNALCCAHGNDFYSYKSVTWCGKSLFPVQRESRDVRRGRKQLEKQAVVDGRVKSKRLKCERQ